MAKLRLLLCLVYFVSLNAFSLDIKDELKAVAQTNITALFADDLNAYVSTTTPDLILVDEIPPFVWKGKNASARYFKDFKTFTSNFKLTELKAEVKDAAWIVEDKNLAYAVFPVNITTRNNEKMKVVGEEGLWTISFKKSKSGKWLLHSSAWSTLKSDI